MREKRNFAARAAAMILAAVLSAGSAGQPYRDVLAASEETEGAGSGPASQEPGGEQTGALRHQPEAIQEREKTQGDRWETQEGAKEEAAGEQEGTKEEAAGGQEGAKEEAAGRQEGAKEEAAGRQEGTKEEAAGGQEGAKGTAGEPETGKEETGEQEGAKEEAAGRQEGAKEGAAGGQEGTKEEAAGEQEGTKEGAAGGQEETKETAQDQDAEPERVPGSVLLDNSWQTGEQQVTLSLTAQGPIPEGVYGVLEVLTEEKLDEIWNSFPLSDGAQPEAGISFRLYDAYDMAYASDTEMKAELGVFDEAILAYDKLAFYREDGTWEEEEVSFAQDQGRYYAEFAAKGGGTLVFWKEKEPSESEEQNGGASPLKEYRKSDKQGTDSWGFETTVGTQSDYRHEGQVFSQRKYTYKLSYSQSDYDESSDIVFFDLLEDGYYTGEGEARRKLESQWRGIFAGADVQEIEKIPSGGSGDIYCRPVVWYSTKDRELFTEEDYDLSNTVTWTRECPADLSSVTAIAADCRKNSDGSDFVFSGRGTLEVYIHMTAPRDLPSSGLYAYNEGRVSVKQGKDRHPAELLSDARVEIEEGDPKLHKESTPETGERMKPAVVHCGDPLVYTLSVTNGSEKLEMDHVLVEDDIPNGLDIASSEVTVWFLDPETKLKISDSPRVTMERSGRHLKFTVATLGAKETVHIEIPCVVTLDAGVLENTARITSVGDVEKEIFSETTYHEVRPNASSLTVGKTVKGSLGDKTYPFSFRLRLTAQGQVLPGRQVYRKDGQESSAKADAEGWISFTLADGETIEFLNLPEGTKFEIQETGAADKGYTVEVQGNIGVIRGKNEDVMFINTKNGVVPTDAWSGLGGWAVYSLAAASSLAAALMKRRRPGSR